MVRIASGILLCGIAVLTVTPQVHAQILYGSVVGRISDPTGAGVQGATITITNKQTGLSRESHPDAAGNFEIPNLLGGAYDVRVTATGFQAFVKSEVPVTINTVTRVDVTLALGAVTETVTV